MVEITEGLIRKRAEHNNCEIYSLEEVSLHQQDIQRITNLDKWCRELKILYLQSNLIPKIENVGRLKKLQYLNLALNNVERIENLEGCESLEKLDLTVNFVGELTSIHCLRHLSHLRELFLTGNPCAEYEGYRDYVIATLPRVQFLDGKEVEKSERIQASQHYAALEKDIVSQQEIYRKKRKQQKADAAIRQARKEKGKTPGFDGRWYTDTNSDNKDKTIDDASQDTEATQEYPDDNKAFWDEKVAFTPEARIEVHEHQQEQKRKDEKPAEPEKPPRRLFNEDGRPLNVNEAKIDFSLTDDEQGNRLVLDVACYRFLDTSLIDVDVQTNYVRVVVKDKIFQLCLTEEINTDNSTAKRSQTTGHLVITMPKVKEVIQFAHTPVSAPTHSGDNKTSTKGDKHELLEVDPTLCKNVDICNIVPEKSDKVVLPYGTKCKPQTDRANSEDFVDNPDVPPLL